VKTIKSCRDRTRERLIASNQTRVAGLAAGSLSKGGTNNANRVSVISDARASEYLKDFFVPSVIGLNPDRRAAPRRFYSHSWRNCVIGFPRAGCTWTWVTSASA